MSLMGILVSWLVLTAGMYLAAKALPGMKIEGGFGSHLMVSAVFGLIFALTGWALHLLLGFLTLGLLFILSFVAQVVVAALVLKITDAFLDRLEVRGAMTALLAGLILSLTDAVARYLLVHV